MSVLCKVLDPSLVDLLKSSIQNTWQFYLKKIKQKNLWPVELREKQVADLGGRATACEGAKTSCAVVHHFRRNQSFALVGFAFSEVPGKGASQRATLELTGAKVGAWSEDMPKTSGLHKPFWKKCTVVLGKMHIYQISTDQGPLEHAKLHQLAASMLTFLPSPSTPLPNFFLSLGDIERHCIRTYKKWKQWVRLI